MTEDFTNVKVGDEVYIDGRYGAVGSIAKVTHVTPTTFKVGHTTYYKTNGYERGGGTWHRSSVSILTDERRAEVWRAITIRILNDFNFELVKNPSELKAILAIVEEARTVFNAAKAAREAARPSA